ncbi:DMT family transporter [Acuticoccus sp.]|uniref:DMT family transporter n=1 Tax=Acuticoccus sp. TaxID=1904378 RepID=UPI003B51C482
MAFALSSTEVDRDTLRGMALMVGAAVVMPCLDAVAKWLGQSMSPAQIAVMRFALQTGLLAVALTLARRPLVDRLVLKAFPKLALAGAFTSVATLVFFWGLQVLPLANAVAIFFVAPLILTAFGALFLGERVGLHRGAAVVVGLVGALIVIRPNFLEFGWIAILPLIAATAFAAVMTTLRSARLALDGFRTQLVTGAFAGGILAIGLVLGTLLDISVFEVSVPAADLVPLIVALGVLGTLGGAMMVFAMRFGEASLLAPLQYVEIVAAVMLGYLVFHEWPDALTFLGMAIILAAGLYTVHRERRRVRNRPLAASPGAHP